MNNNLLFLIKIEITKFLSSLRGGKKKTANRPIIYLLIFLVLLFLGVSFGYSYIVLAPFVKYGINTEIAMSIFAGIASLLIFMSCLSQSRGIYIGEDYDMLSSLPIKKSHIVTSKIFTMYAIELSFALIIMIPHGIMQMAIGHNLSGMLVSFLLAFTLPIVPIAIAILISLLITIATARFKYANFIFVAFYALLIVGFSVLSMLVNNVKDAQAAATFSTVGGILKWVNPSYALIELYMFNSRLYIIAYVGVNLIVAILSILFLALCFDKLHDIVSSISMKKSYVRKDLKTKGVSSTLLSLEFKRLINSKLYFVNSIMGSIMAIMGSTVYLISFSEAIKSAAAKTPEALSSMVPLMMPMFVIIAGLIIGLSNPTTASINIEGKNFWLSKSLPVDYKKYMRVKLVFAWILTLPALLVASTIAAIFCRNNGNLAIELSAGFVIPLIYAILNSMIGLIVAIKHPKLKWNSETEAVKNSASVIISMLINVGISILLIVPLITFPLLLPNLFWMGYLIVFVAILLGIIPCAIYLNKNFAKRIQMIEDL